MPSRCWNFILSALITLEVAKPSCERSSRVLSKLIVEGKPATSSRGGNCPSSPLIEAEKFHWTKRSTGEGYRSIKLNCFLTFRCPGSPLQDDIIQCLFGEQFGERFEGKELHVIEHYANFRIGCTESLNNFSLLRFVKSLSTNIFHYSHYAPEN